MRRKVTTDDVGVWQCDRESDTYYVVHRTGFKVGDHIAALASSGRISECVIRRVLWPGHYAVRWCERIEEELVLPPFTVRPPRTRHTAPCAADAVVEDVNDL